MSDEADRERFLVEAAALTPYVAAEIGDEVFFMPSADRGVGRRVFVKRWRSDMSVLADAVELVGVAPGSAFVDVGANIGTTTVMALRRHGFASGIAIEPSPENFRMLRLNLTANEIDDRVAALQVAASDTAGRFPLNVTRENTGGHRLVPGDRPKRAVEVEAVTLDGLVERGVIDPARTGMVWLDAVKSEGRALAGGTKLLEHGVPIVTALKPDWEETSEQLVEVLTPHYAEVIDLRGDRAPRPIAEFRALVEELERATDVLLRR